MSPCLAVSPTAQSGQTASAERDAIVSIILIIPYSKNCTSSWDDSMSLNDSGGASIPCATNHSAFSAPMSANAPSPLI